MRHFLGALFFLSALARPISASASPPGDDGDPEATSRGEAKTASEEPDLSSEEEGQREENWTYLLDAQEEYRLRHATSPTVSQPLAGPVEAETDHDLRLWLTAGAYQNDDRFSAQLSSALWADLDGSVPGGEPSAMGSVYDLSSPHLWFDFYELWAEYRPASGLAVARGGRQSAQYGLPSTFDGASFQVGVVRRYLDLFLFGGRSVHFFETDAGLFEDWIGSTGAVVRPSADLRFEVDYRFTHEDTVVVSGLDDHSYGITARYRNGEWLRLKAYLRGLDQRLSHTGGAASLTATGLQLGGDLGIDAQTVTLSEVNESEDPYFAILGESRPHIRPRAEVWKEFTTAAGTYAIHGGWNARVLTHGAPSEFNGDHGRFYLLVRAIDIAVAGPFADLTVEYHYEPSRGLLGGDDLLTLGGSAGYDVDDFRAEAGSQYQRLKYDYFIDVDEREDVRSFFVGTRYRLLKWLSIRARYEYEVFDRDLHTFVLTLRQAY